MVYKILRESEQLPWQPNLGKNCAHQFSARNREMFRMYTGDFRAGKFQYAIRFLRESRELPHNHI